MRSIVCVSLGALLVPGILNAQADTALQWQRYCAEAETSLGTAAPGVDVRKALIRARACGPEREGAAVAARLRRSSTVTNLPQLEYEWGRTRLIRDASLFHAAVDIALDGGASIPARVFALRALRMLSFPREDSQYTDLVGGPDERGWPRGRCYSWRTTGLFPTQGAALPENWERVARDAAERVLEDRSQPLDVRTAAACVLGRRID